MSQQITVASASGQYQLCGPNSGHPLVQMEKSSDFSGYVVFSFDSGTVSSGVSLTNAICRQRGSSDPVVDDPAGTRYVNDINVEPATGGLPCYATVICLRGSVTFTVLPEFAGTPDDDAVTLANVDLTRIPVTFPEDLAFQLEVARDQALAVSP